MSKVEVWIWVIIYKWNQILIGKRKWSHGSWTWAFPWGHLDFWETWEDCAIRETKEETWINIKNVRYYKTINNIIAKENRHYITIYMVADYDSWKVDICEPEKCEKWIWSEKQNFPQPLFFNYDDIL